MADAPLWLTLKLGSPGEGHSVSTQRLDVAVQSRRLKAHSRDGQAEKNGSPVQVEACTSRQSAQPLLSQSALGEDAHVPTSPASGLSFSSHREIVSEHLPERQRGMITPGWDSRQRGRGARTKARASARARRV
ncbi:hypothetical protein L1887_57014 [Cichorium endivia]|nr:hypothetical protein L1887_57014 [Cichorium endivia]